MKIGFRGAFLAVLLGCAGIGWPARASDPVRPTPSATPSAVSPTPDVAAQVEQLDREVNVHLRDHEYARALDACKKILELQPGNFRACQRAGWLCNEAQSFPDAEKYLTEAVSLKPDSAVTWTELGLARFRQEKSDDALAAYQKAAELQPSLSNAWFGQGDVYCEHKKNLPKAITAYQAGLKLNPENASANYHLGWCYNESKLFRQALPCLKKAIDLDPDSPSSYTELGYACLETGDYKRSQRACRHALHMNQKSPLAHYVLGLTLVRNGDLSAAREHVAILKSLDPKLKAQLETALRAAGEP